MTRQHNHLAGSRSFWCRAMSEFYLPLILAILVSLLSISKGYGQTTTPSPSVTETDTTPSRTELLSPTPESFKWINREAHATDQLDRTLDLPSVPSRLFMSISLSQAYSDNFDQESENEREEYESEFTLGTSYRIRSPRSFLTLRNTVSALYEIRNDFAKVGFANLAIDTGYDLRNLSLAISETLVVDDNLEQSSTSGIRRERSRFFRNRISPQLRYAFNAWTSTEISYSNIIILEEEDDRNDSITHEGHFQLERLLSRNLIARIIYDVSYDDDQGSEPSLEHDVTVEAEYALTRTTTLLTEYFGTYTDRGSEESDSLRYGGEVGLEYQLLPDLSLFVAAGATVFDSSSRDPRVFFTWQAGLNGAFELTPTTQLRLTSRQTLENTSGDVDDVGIVLRQSYSLGLDQLITAALRLSLFASLTRTEFLESVNTAESDQNRETLFISTGAQLSYRITQALSLRIDYQHRRRDSNRNDDEFIENNVMLTLSNIFSFF